MKDIRKSASGNRNSRSVGVEIVGAIGGRPERRVWTITGVSTDSRTLQPGEIFFALPGARCDGHDFVRAVLEKGAACAVVCRGARIAREGEFHACAAYSPTPCHSARSCNSCPLRDRIVRVADVRRALGDSARAYRRRWGGLVIAVTGSNGKTTTREMIYHVLSEKMPCRRSPKSYNTDVGVPLTLFQSDPSDRAIIVEMGTNAPGEIAALAAIAEPDIGVITNVSEAHLDGLGSVEGVARAKAELLEGLGPKGVAFLNADDPWTQFLSSRHTGKIVTYGTRREATFRGREVQPLDAGPFEGSYNPSQGWPAGHSFLVRGGLRVELSVPGRHNVHNALAALAVADYLGLSLADAAARLSAFRLPEMRCQVEEIRGIKVVFDGYNANPGSMHAAIEAFRETAVPGCARAKQGCPRAIPDCQGAEPVCAEAKPGRRVAVLGDMNELGTRSEELHRAIGAEVARSGVDALWAVGKFSGCIAQAAEESGLAGRVARSDELDPVAQQLCDYLQPGDAVLVKGSRGLKMERLVEKLRAVGERCELEHCNLAKVSTNLRKV